MRTRKALSLLLALVLVLGLSVPAMAAGEIDHPVKGIADFYSSEEPLGTETDSFGNEHLIYPLGTVFQYRGTEFDLFYCNAESKPGVQAHPIQLTVAPGETLQPQDPDNVERYDLLFSKDKHSKGAVHIVLKDPNAPEPAPVEEASIPSGQFRLYSSRELIRTDKDADGHDVLVFPAGTGLKYDDTNGTVTCSRQDSGEQAGIWRGGKSFALPETGVVYKVVMNDPMMGPIPAYVMLEGDASTTAPTVEPTVEPTVVPTVEPTAEPTVEPTAEPTPAPTEAPTEGPLTIGDYYDAQVIFSDVVSRESVRGAVSSFTGNPNAVLLITVKVGTTLTTDADYWRSDNGRTFFFAWVNEDGFYTYDRESVENFNTGVPDGTPFTLTDEHIGLWFGTGGMELDYYLNVIPNDDSAPVATPVPTAEPTPVPTEAPVETPVPTEAPVATPVPTEAPAPVTTPVPTETETPVETVAGAAPGAGVDAYIVQEGDTLSTITTNYYGSNAKRSALYKANAEAFKATKGKLVPGMVLTIPEKLGKTQRILPAAAVEGETLYTVKAGDTLGKIALTQYGSMAKYKDIFERNKDRLKNANSIYQRQVIVLPAK